jgi:hypothetical protein
LTDAGTYVLDTGVVVGLQKSGHLGVLANAAKAVRLVLVEDVYDELIAPRGGKRAVEAKEAKTLIDASDVQKESILIGSPMADAYESLRTGKTSPTADVGEAASIAYAIHHPEAVFVANDRAAALRGLQELRGRTMSFHPFLRVLVDSRGVTRREAEQLGKDIRKLSDWSAPEPLWWFDWALG